MKLRNHSVGQEIERERRLRTWTYVAVMLLAILLSLPLTPFLWNKAIAIFGPRLNSAGYVLTAFIGVVLIFYMLRHREKYGVLSYLSLAGLSLVYAYLMKYHCRFPAERLHLIEYGLLAFLSYRAFRFDFSNAYSYGLALLFSSVFGCIDEGIQYVLPNRNFEVRDVLTNIFASALGLLVTAVLVRAVGEAADFRLPPE